MMKSPHWFNCFSKALGRIKVKIWLNLLNSCWGFPIKIDSVLREFIVFGNFRKTKSPGKAGSSVWIPLLTQLFNHIFRFKTWDHHNSTIRVHWCCVCCCYSHHRSSMLCPQKVSFLAVSLTRRLRAFKLVGCRLLLTVLHLSESIRQISWNI